MGKTNRKKKPTKRQTTKRQTTKRQTKKIQQIKFWKKMKTIKKKKKIYLEGDCTYYIVQHGEGYSEGYSNFYLKEDGVEIGDFNNIFPVIDKNFEIIRIVPPMWVMMSNDMVNKNFRKLLNNGIGENFWKLWNRQFSRNRDAQLKQIQPSNDKNIGVVQMNQMPLLAKTMQLFEHSNRYYNEMLQHDTDGDFGIWRRCEWSKKWTCIFNNKTIHKLQNNDYTMYNLLYNEKNIIKTYSMRNLINVLLDREYRGSKKRFIFASCSPLQTFDRTMRLKDYIRPPSDSSIDKNYWYRRLIELQYRIFIYTKGNEMFIKKVGTHGSTNNTLDYQHYDLGEKIAIAENDERRDIYIHFNAFFRWLRSWDPREGYLFNFPMAGPMDRIQTFTAIESIKYILYYLKRNIYNGGISPNILVTKKMDHNSSRIYNRLKENHGKDFSEIFKEIDDDNFVIDKPMQTSNTSSNQMGDNSEEHIDTSLPSLNNSSEQYIMFSNTPTDAFPYKKQSANTFNDLLSHNNFQRTIIFK